jgi:hypothetical protein
MGTHKHNGNWQICVAENGTAPICPLMRDVRVLFGANYRNYVATYTDPSFGCNSDGKNPNPVTLTRALMLRSVHGWSPFNDNCTNAQGNLLKIPQATSRSTRIKQKIMPSIKRSKRNLIDCSIGQMR